MTLIAGNVAAVVLESEPSVGTSLYGFFRAFEAASVAIFTVEYVARVWTADLKLGRESRVAATLLYVISPMALVDLAAVLPFYLPLILPVDLRSLRILRLTRLLRMLKVQRYSESLQLIGRVFRKKREELIVTVFVTGMLILLASAVMYELESDVQPDKFPSILATLWWAIATLTTIGYGDVYPVTGWGRLLSGVIAVLGIGIVALPTGLLSSGFMEELSARRRGHSAGARVVCPHCGREISAGDHRDTK